MQPVRNDQSGGSAIDAKSVREARQPNAAANIIQTWQRGLGVNPGWQFAARLVSTGLERHACEWFDARAVH